MQAVENYAVGECSVGESPATTSIVRIPEGPAVFSAPSNPNNNNPKKFRDSKPKTQKQCIKCDSPAVIHSFCADWCDECWNAPTVRLSSGSIVHRAPTPVATKPKIKIIRIKCDCRGYKGCGNKLTTKVERGAKMCESCINIWKGFEKDDVAYELRSDMGAAIYAARNASVEVPILQDVVFE